MQPGQKSPLQAPRRGCLHAPRPRPLWPPSFPGGKLTKTDLHLGTWKLKGSIALSTSVFLHFGRLFALNLVTCPLKLEWALRKVYPIAYSTSQSSPNLSQLTAPWGSSLTLCSLGLRQELLVIFPLITELRAASTENRSLGTRFPLHSDTDTSPSISAYQALDIP